MDSGKFASSSPSANSYGITPLMRAAEKGDLEKVKLLIDQECSMQNNQGKTALMYAAESGHIDCVKFLISYEVGMQDNEGNSALMYAAQVGISNMQICFAYNKMDSAAKEAHKERYTKCVELLVPHEAKMQNNEGVTALMYAAKCGNNEAVNALVPHEAGRRDRKSRTALINAIDCGRSNISPLLLSAEMCIKDAHDKTVLMYAANFNLMPIILQCREILAKQQRDDGRTALMIAAKHGWTDAIEALIPYEAKMQDNTGLTALMVAIKSDKKSAVDLLIPHEAKMQDSTGLTALMHVAGHTFKSGSLISNLIPHEAKIQDSTGRTALMVAAGAGHGVFVNLLIPHEAKMQDSTGRTALMVAAENNRLTCVRYLARQEASIINREGFNARTLAFLKSNEEVEKFLAAHEELVLSFSQRFRNALIMDNNELAVTFLLDALTAKQPIETSALYATNSYSVYVGSFFDIITRAIRAKGRDTDYESAISIAMKHMEGWPVSKLAEYCLLEDLQAIGDALKVDFSDYADFIEEAMSEISGCNRCCVYLEEDVPLLRTCSVCKSCVVCTSCVLKIEQCCFCKTPFTVKNLSDTPTKDTVFSVEAILLASVAEHQYAAGVTNAEDILKEYEAKMEKFIEVTKARYAVSEDSDATPSSQ